MPFLQLVHFHSSQLRLDFYTALNEREDFEMMSIPLSSQFHVGPFYALGIEVQECLCNIVKEWANQQREEKVPEEDIDKIIGAIEATLLSVENSKIDRNLHISFKVDTASVTSLPEIFELIKF